jgi:hypothetical protein
MSTQTLYHKLQQAKTEEDVKDIYIKALGLKSYTEGLIDIRTKEIWFEAKNTGKHSSYAMFTQLLHYVQQAFNKGEELPPFLAIIDTEKAALMKTKDILPLLEKKAIKWGKSASQYPKEALDEVSAYIGAHFVPFHISTHEEEFISTVKEAIKTGEILSRQITPDNLKQVFDKWVEMIGRELTNAVEKDYNLLFMTDIMSEDGCAIYDDLPAELLYKCKSPVFILNKKRCELANGIANYKKFWTIYHRPPKLEHRHYLLERRDSLIPLNERSFKGAYYTPLNVVDKAYDKLAEILGENWQENYIIWDMCCGVGNLEVKHSNPRNVFMSTLDQADLDIIQANKTCAAAQRFQYDYLNDDISDDGKIDYNLTQKVPEELRQAIAENKKILVLINPPYAESTSSDNVVSGGAALASKTGVAKTKFAATAMADYGKASNELFTQFVARVAREIPTATLAMFSTLKYVNSQTMDVFRSVWNAKYLGGFVVHSKAFDGLKGDFPIGFLVWATNQHASRKQQIIEIATEVFDKNVQPIGEKRFYNLPNDQLLTNWIERPKTNKADVIPLKNAVTPATATKDLRGTKWSDNAIAYLWCNSNDLQQAARTALFSSGFNGGHGIFVNPENLWQAAIVFSVRRLIKPTWLNDRDQFLQPTQPLTAEFQHDCLIWMLFNGSNLTASANDLEWNGKKWSIVNHFIPFTESEVNATGRFESDFMVQYLKNKQLSKQATAVLNAGRELWKAYFSHTDGRNVCEELKLNRPDVGWYQIRNALKKRNDSGDFKPVDFSEFEQVYKTLTEKLQPQVFELGFLRI